MRNLSLLLLLPCAIILAACTAIAPSGDVSSNRLANYSVVDPGGVAVASVEDVVISAESGEISYVFVILQRDPFSYGMAAPTETSVPRTAVPWSYLSLDSPSEQLQLKVDRSVLYEAPLLEDHPDRLGWDWDAEIQAYWRTYTASGFGN